MTQGDDVEVLPFLTGIVSHHLTLMNGLNHILMMMRYDPMPINSDLMFI